MPNKYLPVYANTTTALTAGFPTTVFAACEYFDRGTYSPETIAFTVPASAPYKVQLPTVVSSSQITVTVGGAARTITGSTSPAAGTFHFDKLTGIITFNSADAGGSASVTLTPLVTVLGAQRQMRVEAELEAVQTRAALGPAAGGSTDNALARWDATTGRLLQNSVAILTDAGALSGIDTITFAPDIAHQIVWVDGAKEWGIYGDATGGFIISADNGTDSPTVAALRSNANISGVGVTSGWYIAGVDGHYALSILNGDIGLSDGTNTLRLQAATLTAGRTITFPDATGTVALTSDLSSYLPLTGGTLTGGLTGTTGTFTGAVQASRVNSTNTNTIHGTQAGNSVTSATFLTCLGYQAGYSATTMQQGVFVGWRAGYSATTGIANVCVGESAGYNISTGADNVLVGSDAGSSVAGTGDNQHGITTGSHNTAIGNNAGVNRPTFQTDDLDVDTTGNHNTALGFSTSWGGSSTATRRTAVGAYALVDEDDCIVLGADPATAPGGVAATKVKVPGALQVNGNATIGDSSGDAHSVNGLTTFNDGLAREVVWTTSPGAVLGASNWTFNGTGVQASAAQSLRQGIVPLPGNAGSIFKRARLRWSTGADNPAASVTINLLSISLTTGTATPTTVATASDTASVSTAEYRTLDFNPSDVTFAADTAYFLHITGTPGATTNMPLHALQIEMTVRS